MTAGIRLFHVEPHEAGDREEFLEEASKARGHLAGGWGWGSRAFVDTLHLRGLLVSGAVEVPCPSPPQGVSGPSCPHLSLKFPIAPGEGMMSLGRGREWHMDLA